MAVTADKTAQWSVSCPANGDQCVVTISGDWGQPPAQLSDNPLLPKDISSVMVQVDDLTGYGTYLAAFLYRLHRECSDRGLPSPNTDKLPEGVREMLKLALATSVQPLPTEYPLTWRGRLVALFKDVQESAISWLAFTGNVLIALKRLFTRRARMQWSDVYGEIIKSGPKAMGIVVLIGFLMGLILAFISSIPLKLFRAESYVSSLIGIGMLRLLGVVMTGVVMAGRTGAAYAAELGTMQVNEEIDALESMDISPIEFLVLPRMIALTLMMPFLFLYGSIAGILGGCVVAVYYLDLTLLIYWEQLVSMTRLNDLYVGLFTSVVFGVLVAACGCFRGLQCGRSSEAVGQATTSAMVTSIIFLVISTSVITVLTVFLKI